MSNNVVIRKATISDAEDVGRLATTFQAYLRSLGDQADFDWGAAKYVRDGFGEKPAFEGLVAEVDSKVAGYLLYHYAYETDKGQRYVYIIDLYVDDSFRSQGLGSALMKQVAEVGRSNGATGLMWSVYKPNISALKFYEKIGAHYLDQMHFMTMKI